MARDDRSAPYLIFSLALSVATLTALAFVTFSDPPIEVLRVLLAADVVVCVAFFVDFLYQLFRAPDRRQYLLRWGWLDLLSCIPLVEALRWTRVARILRIVALLRALRSFRAIWRLVVERSAESAILAALLLTLLLLTFSSVAVLYAETGPEAKIRTAGDALWWSLSTITTVGYGDVYPVTGEGRLVAVVLMTCGVGLFATLSGALAAWFLRLRQVPELEALRAENRQLKAALDALAAATANAASSVGDQARAATSAGKVHD